MKNWNIFIITHKHIFQKMYEGDPLFSQDNYKFINISDQVLDECYTQKYSIINMHEMQDFIPLGVEYAESEAIYNLYKNARYYQALDFVGFLHYDKELKLHTGKNNITERINNYLHDKQKAHISFCAHDMAFIHSQSIMADPNRPYTLIGKGKNCIDYILSDFNSFFNTKFTLKSLLSRKNINMESCFLIDTPTFIKMMQFCAYIIESKKLEIFDPSHQQRFQGQLLERYFGVFLALEYDEFLNLSLPHHPNLKLI